MLKHINFESRKPSIVQIKSAIKRARAAGGDYIQVQWGENEITVERMADKRWTGHGWIGRHGGSDLADLMNKEAP